MNINVIFDSSAASAPAGFEADVNYVVSLFDQIFTNPVTINVRVGWGEVHGQPLGSGNLGESIEQFSDGYGYNQILNAVDVTALQAGDPIPGDVLSVIDPTNAGTFDPGSAGARALGLMPANSNETDGWIGLSSQPGTFSFDASNPPGPGLYDAVAVIEHELTEVMGRGSGLNPSFYSMQDLFRFSAPGSLDLVGNHTDYFSIDKGVSSLDVFNNDASAGDLGDWAGSAGADAMLAFAMPGVTESMTTIDLIEMAAIGWSDIPAILSSAFTNVLWTSPTSTLATTPTLTLANGSSVPNPIYQDANALPGLSSQVSANQTTIEQALSTVEQDAAATTMVSSLTYEFFTGATPTAGGYQYLIDSPSNPNNLDSSYYALFNIQNRYINFSVNLGKYGAGMTPFNDTYGGTLTLGDAATKAYTEIFGAAPAAGKIDAILNAEVTSNGITETRAQYFAYYGGDGPNGIGTKAAMVGWLLEVAAQDNLGPYAGAGNHFVSDLALGNAPFNIDLLPEYGYQHQVPLIGV
jgi:hypothetical protein